MGQPLKLHHWQRNFSRDAFNYGDTVLHLDASTITASDGDRIEEWENLSDNDIIVSQSTLLDRPIYRPTAMAGHPALEFNIQEFFNVTNDNVTGSLLRIGPNSHIMAVLHLRALSSGTNVIRTIINRQEGPTGNDRTFWFVHWDSEWIYRNATASLPSNDNSILAPELVGITGDADNNDIKMRLQGVQQTASIGFNAGRDDQPCTIGSQTDNTRKFDGWMSEILIYPSLLANDKLEEVETHLINKWGIE